MGKNRDPKIVNDAAVSITLSLRPKPGTDVLDIDVSFDGSAWRQSELKPDHQKRVDAIFGNPQNSLVFNEIVKAQVQLLAALGIVDLTPQGPKVHKGPDLVVVGRAPKAALN